MSLSPRVELSASLPSAATLPCAPAPLGHDLGALFPWDKSYTFLNHGSFGSSPYEVLAAQTAWRMEIEARPIEMLGRRVSQLLAPARAAVGKFVGVDPARLGFVVNATEGVNAVLRSIAWQRGDEIVVIDHVYNAMRQSIRRLADECGVVLREIVVPLPVAGPHEFADAIDAACNANTRMVLIDHITSPTALLIPVAQIVKRARARGILTLVDGAHAPGSIALSVDEIDADAYTANLHKWCCAPKGSAFLAVRGDLAARVHPLATSHPYHTGFVAEFDWQGTRDISPWLTTPAALAFFERFGWDNVRAHNHAMATWTQLFLCETWSATPLSPLDGSMLASMAAVRIPAATQARFASPELLQACLYDMHRIEIPVIDWKGAWHVRVSCHLHTTPAMVERLACVILALRA
ncbi:MAG: aminotransferase class V-fold PLP-dependent enzyme [Planctomycetota bacterium]|nr:MAG: aminotransferase class V-fold PLP-dependent enzyme [Planctomycetota bacterium]